ncbi:hypothetical protein KA111_02200 [Candidatus Woesebacteria bacterium]|nr:hypothetical protein [Candidatus Woesebacteria bacterium]
MPKKVFWPASLVTMGFVFLASNLGYLPRAFWNLWPVILIVVGLGGLLTSDSDAWDTAKSTEVKKAPAQKMAKKSAKTTRKRKK